MKNCICDECFNSGWVTFKDGKVYPVCFICAPRIDENGTFCEDFKQKTRYIDKNLPHRGEC